MTTNISNCSFDYFTINSAENFQKKINYVKNAINGKGSSNKFIHIAADILSNIEQWGDDFIKEKNVSLIMTCLVNVLRDKYYTEKEGTLLYKILNTFWNTSIFPLVWQIIINKDLESIIGMRCNIFNFISDKINTGDEDDLLQLCNNIWPNSTGLIYKIYGPDELDYNKFNDSEYLIEQADRIIDEKGEYAYRSIILVVYAANLGIDTTTVRRLLIDTVIYYFGIDAIFVDKFWPVIKMPLSLYIVLNLNKSISPYPIHRHLILDPALKEFKDKYYEVVCNNLRLPDLTDLEKKDRTGINMNLMRAIYKFNNMCRKEDLFFVEQSGLYADSFKLYLLLAEFYLEMKGDKDLTRLYISKFISLAKIKNRAIPEDIFNRYSYLISMI